MEVDSFISMGVEATKIDYKLNLEQEKPKSWLKSVSAFANTSGGQILFGYTDNSHEAVGLDNPQAVASKISELIEGRISPHVRFELNEIPATSQGKLCLELIISNGPHYPYYYLHDRTMEAYIRHGDRSVIATPEELNNLILKGQNRTYDSLPSKYKIEDVSFTLLKATYKKETGDDFVLPRDLLSMGFADYDGMVTNAGLLLCDQGFIHQSKIVCTRWKGTEKGSIDGDALDDQEFSDASMITLLGNAESFIRNNSKSAWTVRGMRREEKSDYPFRAVREVLVNALIHRDYQIIGTEVHVDMFDDRLEITSPGGMINGSRIQDLDLKRVPSMRRNEIISDIFGRLHYMDRRGSGIGRIINSYTDFAEKPVFYSNEFYFQVVLPNRSVSMPAQLALDFSEKSQLSDEKSQLSDEKSQLSGEKSQLSGEKTQLVERKFNSSQDWELIYFQERIIEQLGKDFRKNTMEKLVRLFDRYRYEYSFNRRNIADLFGITENGASAFIKKCLLQGIIEKEKMDSYRFINSAVHD